MSAPAAQASVQRVFDGPNGAVSALAKDANGNVYLGGGFTAWGPQTGTGGVVDATSAAVDRSFSPVVGTIQSAAPDGSGGWYIGGNLSSGHGR